MELIESTTLATSFGTSLNDETFVREDGVTVKRTVIRRPDAAAVLVAEGDNVYLVRQSREAVGEDCLLEVAAGKIDPGETPQQAAVRELEEEIGFRGSLQFVKEMLPSAGYTAERIFLYLCTDAKAKVDGEFRPLSTLDHSKPLTDQIDQNLDHDEAIELVRLDVHQALLEAQDSKALVLIQHYLLNR